MADILSLEELKQGIDPAFLDLLTGSIEPGSHAQVAGRYEGGVRCVVHAVDLTTPSGACLELVVKQFPAEFLEEDPGAIEREWRVLELLARSQAPAPGLVWVELDGKRAGTPTLVMTRLQGIPLMRVQAKQPSSDSSWVRPVVASLVQIQRTSLTERDLEFLPVMDSRSIEKELRGMAESDVTQRLQSLPWGEDIWHALEWHWESHISEPLVLVHGDFHAGNILWDGDRVSGVIDWAAVSVGAADRNLAHLRWETILRYDPEVLDFVQRTYEEGVGHTMPASPIWDLLLMWKLGDAIRSWIWFFEIEGRGSVNLQELERRRRLLIERALDMVR